MIISDIQIPERPQVGLSKVSLSKLGQVVLLAGRNGAGKSRVLNALIQYLAHEPIEGLGWTVVDLPENVKPWARSNKIDISTHADLKEVLKANLGEGETYHFAIAKWDSVRLSVIESFRFVWLTPKSPELRDVRNLTKKEIEFSSNAATKSSIKDLREQALARIQSLQDRWFHAGFDSVQATADAREVAIKAYERLQKLSEALLGIKFERDLDGNATLYDKPIGEAGLSEGQKILLLWTVMLHSQVEHLNQAVIICDEPENHLHPQAMLDALDRVLTALPGVQIWIATHSLPLLSHFDPSSIFWVEDGKIEFAGTKPLRVLRGLLGDDARIAKLHDFLGLPGNLAANRFTAQCILPPGVSDKGEGDPQTNQIHNILKSISTGSALRVLDFGAGRGRLASNFAALKQSGGADSLIDYFAFEPSPDHKPELMVKIEALHSDSAERERIFHDFAKLTAVRGLNSFDVIVLCNVLHEIPVDQWLSLFGPSGRFIDLLSDNGHILLVEDTLLPVGECPHPGGFMVLESAPLYCFLKCSPDQLIRDESVSNNRLVAHLIPKQLVSQATQESLKAALAQVAKIADEKLKALQGNLSSTTSDSDGNAKYRSGREHAFYIHQFANACRALKVNEKIGSA